MKKLKLELDALAVESFEVAAEPRSEGTVYGFDEITRTCVCTLDCSYWITCPPPPREEPVVVPISGELNPA